LNFPDYGHDLHLVTLIAPADDIVFIIAHRISCGIPDISMHCIFGDVIISGNMLVLNALKVGH